MDSIGKRIEKRCKLLADIAYRTWLGGSNKPTELYINGFLAGQIYGRMEGTIKGISIAQVVLSCGADNEKAADELSRHRAQELEFLERVTGDPDADERAIRSGEILPVQGG